MTSRIRSATTCPATESVAGRMHRELLAAVTEVEVLVAGGLKDAVGDVLQDDVPAGCP